LDLLVDPWLAEALYVLLVCCLFVARFAELSFVVVLLDLLAAQAMIFNFDYQSKLTIRRTELLRGWEGTVHEAGGVGPVSLG